MKKETIANTHRVNETNVVKKFSQIKLGVDVHADSYRVVRQIDSATPQPAQKMTPAKFLEFAARQLSQAEEVHSCYEAGPFGYALHRRLLQMRIKNVVVRPQNWDELGRGVKTDQTDALALVQRLDRYVQGNSKALAVIHVPSPQQEQERALSRHRQQLQKDRQTHEAQGRSLLLYQGHRISGQWWKERAWEKLKEKLEVWLVEILENLRGLILCADQLLQQVSVKIEGQAKDQPKGFGALTSEVLRREVLDWKRFKNRRQVASLTGMCPGVRASGQKSVSGSITKHGNPRLRRALVELAWRVARYQPLYKPVAKWKEMLTQKQNRGGRKKAIVAIGRRLAIDLWRIETGRCTAQDLQLR
ncbi:MAG: IS110 family transposase [Actinobacteria bacterium]|nr:IS110 family transposase [Actinomycetota bacterium]